MKGGGYIKDDGSISLQAPPEKQRIKRNLSEGEKVLSFLVKLHRERVFLFTTRSRGDMCFSVNVNQNPHLQCTRIALELCLANGNRVPVGVKKINIQIVLCYLKFSLFRPDVLVTFSVACGSVWFTYCHLWKTESCVQVFPFPFVCTGVCVCTPICVFATQMYLYTNCFDFIKLTSFQGNTSWPRSLLLGCHITHCRRTVPIICHSAYLL